MCGLEQGGDTTLDTSPARVGSRPVRHTGVNDCLSPAQKLTILHQNRMKGYVGNMKLNVDRAPLRIATAALVFLLSVTPAVPAIKNMAVVVSTANKLADVPLADLAKLCKGAQKTWSDGKSFVLVLKGPDSSEMKAVVQKLFGATSSEARASIAKVNEGRQIVKIVENDEELLRTVESTPGAVGIVDVYAINSSVKVLRVDGKLPFDVGYAFKSN